VTDKEDVPTSISQTIVAKFQSKLSLGMKPKFSSISYIGKTLLKMVYCGEFIISCFQAVLMRLALSKSQLDRNKTPNLSISSSWNLKDEISTNREQAKEYVITLVDQIDEKLNNGEFKAIKEREEE